VLAINAANNGNDFRFIEPFGKFGEWM